MLRNELLAEKPMQYRFLGRSGLRLSVLGLGTVPFGSKGGELGKWGCVNIDGARRMIDLCLDMGVNWIDTSNAYSLGSTEEVCGEALKGRRRERLLIATKVRFAMSSGPNDAGLSRFHLINQCEASLRRLKTDHIDLYQMHSWDGQTPLEETLEALDSLVRNGKVRYIGASNYSAWHLMKALAVAEREHRERFVAHQIYYSLQARDAEWELVPLSIDQGVGVLVWSPLAGGWLTGKYRRHQPMPQHTRYALNYSEPPVRDAAQLYDIVDVLVSVAQARKATAAQIAIAWLLERPGVTSVVLGARNEMQLAENLLASDVTLSLDERTKLDAVSAMKLPYPYWHQAKWAKDRLSAADIALLTPYV
jgi:aryl-alcohol dehydrogenase-like predicted oxidoreductase